MTTPKPMIDEKEIKDYLLGRLADEQKEDFETRLWDDDELLEALKAVEEDLIDDYIVSELSATDRNRFESHYLTSENRRKQVALAYSLNKIALESRSKSQAATVGFWQRIQAALVPFLQPLPAMALGLLVVVTVLAGWLIRQTAQLNQQKAQLAAEIQTEKTQREAAQSQIAALEKQRGEDKKQPQKSEDNKNQYQRAADAPDNIVVQPNSREEPAARGDDVPSSKSVPMRIKIPKGTITLLLPLLKEQETLSNLGMILYRNTKPSRVPVWPKKGIAPAKKQGLHVRAEVPIRSLNRGDYVVALFSGRGDSEKHLGNFLLRFE